MAYKKTNWQDTFKDAQGNVTQEGTKISATRLNNMEDGIEGAASKEELQGVTAQLDGKETVTGSQAKADASLLTAKTYADGVKPDLTGYEKTVDVNSKDAATLTSAKSYTDTKVAGIVNTAPEALDTLNELAAALGDDPNFATTVATQIGTKVDKVVGMGLSTNDYSTFEKTKLSGIDSEANRYIHPASHAASMITGLATVATSGSYADLSNKPVIPAAVTLNNTVTSTSTTQAATANSVKTAYDRAQEAFTSASNGKTLIANAITGKGTPANPDDSFAVLATAIGSIATGKKVAVRTVNVPANSTDRVVVTDLDFTPRIVFGMFTGLNDRQFAASSDGSLANKVIYDSNSAVITFAPNASGFVASVSKGASFFGEYKVIAIE